MVQSFEQAIQILKIDESEFYWTHTNKSSKLSKFCILCLTLWRIKLLKKEQLTKKNYSSCR